MALSKLANGIWERMEFASAKYHKYFNLHDDCEFHVVVTGLCLWEHRFFIEEYLNNPAGLTTISQIRSGKSNEKGLAELRFNITGWKDFHYHIEIRQIAKVIHAKVESVDHKCSPIARNAITVGLPVSILLWICISIYLNYSARPVPTSSSEKLKNMLTGFSLKIFNRVFNKNSKSLGFL